MTNPYYEAGGVTRLTLARAETINAEFQSVEDGFDLVKDAIDGVGQEISEAVLDPNSPAASEAEARAGIENSHFMTALRTAQALDTQRQQPNFAIAAKTDTFTTTSLTYTDLTGLSVSITPRKATSRILVFASIYGTTSLALDGLALKVLRGSTDLALGDAAGSRTRGLGGLYGNVFGNACLIAIDSPATTSSTTYKIQCALGAAGTGYINRDATDNDNAVRMRTVSSIAVMEVE